MPSHIEQPAPPMVLINARLIDPASGRDEPGGVLIENGALT
jgi:predicted amidohydrolase